MQRVLPDQPHLLHGTAATRAIEEGAAAALPAHTLMQRAGLATARLARALAPHARQVWIVCGPGNNGGDGLEAAAHLHRPDQGVRVTATWLGDEQTAPADALRSLAHARAAGVRFAAAPERPLTPDDLAIDALLGLGLSPTLAGVGRSLPRHAARPPRPLWTALLHRLRTGPAPLLCVDLPSGLQADTGTWAAGFAPAETATGPATPTPTPPRHTLSLLTLKPGLFTADGRDACGTVWWDALGTAAEPPDPEGAGTGATARLIGPLPAVARAHNSHKGRFGDVAVIGGEGLSRRGMGMEGAALLAARAALHAGAGRVLVALLDADELRVAAVQPELMQRRFGMLDLQALTVVCGCGGGDAVAEVLAAVLARAPRLVLDADALNAVAGDGALQAALRARALHGQSTVLTPHPLEAARLLGMDTAQVQADRLAAAQAVAERFDCVCVLKGSGSIVAAPGALPQINPTGNARLATGGTGDVLAGMVGAHLAAGEAPATAAARAVYGHGHMADRWPSGRPLTAGALAGMQF